MALTIADSSCGDPSSSDIYFDCGNGTVTDNRTGLIWLKNVGCLTMGTGGPSLAKLTWDRATIEAHNLSDGMCDLTDGSKAGDWRIATKREWTKMMSDGVDLDCLLIPPSLTNATGDLCHSEDPIFTDFCDGSDNGSDYWTTTSVTGVNNTDVWVKVLFDGAESSTLKTNTRCLWPVRLSQGPGG